MNVYAATDYYLFEDDINAIVSNNNLIKLNKTSSKEETKEMYQSLVEKYGDKTHYYNSGSSMTIKSVNSTLKSKGISSKNIIDDMFLGY